MKQRDRTKARRTLLGVWKKVLVIADEMIAEDRAKGEDVEEALKIRRSIMRKISRLKRLINRPSPGPKKNSLHQLQNAVDNASLSGVSNG